MLVDSLSYVDNDVLRLVDVDKLVDSDAFALVDNDALFDAEVLSLVDALVLANVLAFSDAFERESLKLVLSLCSLLSDSDFALYSDRYSF